MMRLAVITLALAAIASARILDYQNEVVAPRINSGNELLSSIVHDCFDSSSSATECLKVKVLTYLDTVLGMNEESVRSFASENIDEAIYERVGKVIERNEFKAKLPEFFFQGAEVTYRADRGLDVEFPEERNADGAEARGILKKKLLLPVLLLLKLKMKLLMPIFVALIGLKALKALILSKVAILLVVGFLVMNLLKKGGMPMPMAMAPAPEPTPPSSAYGPANGATQPPAPTDSYSPQWEPNANGPYSRVWDPSSSHNMAYSAYYPGSSSSSSSSGSSSSYSSPSASSVSITTASGSS